MRRFKKSQIILLTCMCLGYESLQATEDLTKKLEHADRLFDAASYSEAQSLYREILALPLTDEQIYRTRYQIALTHYYEKDDLAALNILKEQLPPKENNLLLWEIYNDSLFLKALVLKNRGNFQEALKALDLYLSTADSPLLKHYFSAIYEKGCILYQLNNDSEAKEQFQLLLDAKVAQDLQLAAKISLEHLRLRDKNYKKVEDILYKSQAYALRVAPDSLLSAFNAIEQFLLDYPKILVSVDNPDEVLYMRNLFAANLTKEDQDHYLPLAEEGLKNQLAQYPQGKNAAKAYLLLGTLAFEYRDKELAKRYFLKAAEEYPSSLQAGDGFFWASKCAEQLKESPETIKMYKKKVYENYSTSPYSGEAYFSYYTFSEYLQGNPDVTQHLKAMPLLFPQSPFILNAYYLLGMDEKTHRKNASGEIIRKRSLTNAIDNFHAVEASFDLFFKKKLITEDRLEYFINLRYRAMLERALANAAIAEESKGAKRHIYFEYAVDVFTQIIRDFEDDNNELTALLKETEPYPSIYEESQFSLARAYLKENNDTKAEERLDHMIEKYRAAKITRAYFLSRAWYEKGQIALRKQNTEIALSCFENADDAGKGKILSPDEKLDLWIELSLCLKTLHQQDKAMLLLSKVINEDAISGLRLKAMYLRAEIYAMEGRHELAKKQLEATARKGGEWGLKAKEALENGHY